MFDLEEIPTGMTPNGRTATGPNPDKDAKARAMAMLNGLKWKCSRVKAWVSIDDCVARYAMAREDKSGDYQPCLECSSIVLHLRNMGKGLPSPISMQTPPMSAPRFEPKPLPKPKEATMARPAKKEHPQEVKPESKLEIVTRPAPEVKGKAASLTDPFDGWTKYDPKARYIEQSDIFASFSAAGILSLSVAAQEQVKLQLYSSVDVLHAGDKIGLRLHPGKKGALAIVTKTKNKSSATISGRGFLRKFKLDGVCGKRFTVREIAPGFVEIDLKSEVAA